MGISLEGFIKKQNTKIFVQTFGLKPSFLKMNIKTFGKEIFGQNEVDEPFHFS